MRGVVTNFRGVCCAGLDPAVGYQAAPEARLGRRSPHLFHTSSALPHEQQHRTPDTDRRLRSSVLALGGLGSGGCPLPPSLWRTRKAIRKRMKYKYVYIYHIRVWFDLAGI